MNKKTPEELLKQSLRLFDKPSLEVMESVGDRVRVRLRSETGKSLTQSDESLELARKENRRARWGRIAMIPAAAAVMTAVFIGLAWRQDALAIGESVDGSLLRVINGKAQSLRAGETISIGDTLRSDSGGTFKLADGSGVEMKSESELTFEGAKSALQINLSHGSVIVNSETQPVVQTRDVRVPIAGTVFVNAESGGSRVAVIQGEARVRQGAIEKTLRPGEQIATNPSMELSPVSQEIAWSPRAVAHMALLQQSVVAPANPREANIPKWEAVSVRPCDSWGGGGGRGGGGGTGISRPNWADPQLLVVSCKNLWTLMQLAYANIAFDVPGARGGSYAFIESPIVGGPDWIWREPYTIEAKAEKPVDPALLRGPMLRTILEDRFKLKLGREIRDKPLLVLTVAKGGPKNLKPHQEGSCVAFSLGNGSSVTPETRGMPPVKPACGFADNGFVAAARLQQPPTRHQTQEVRGLTVEEFIQGVMVGFIAQNETPVVDKTGIKGKFDFKLEYAFTPQEIKLRIEGGRGPLGDPRDVGRPESDFDTGPTVWEALEEQLGLKLEKTKGPWPHLVIEHVERPSPN